MENDHREIPDPSSREKRSMFGLNSSATQEMIELKSFVAVGHYRNGLKLLIECRREHRLNPKFMNGRWFLEGNRKRTFHESPDFSARFYRLVLVDVTITSFSFICAYAVPFNDNQRISFAQLHFFSILGCFCSPANVPL